MIDQRTPVLSVRNLKQYFVSGHGKNRLVVPAVDNISFDIFKGEVFGLVGESGCGKTTTGRTIIKLYDPTDGEIYFFGKRTSAGTLGLKDGIRDRRIATANQISSLKTDQSAEIAKATGADASAIRSQYAQKINAIKSETQEYIIAARREIAARDRKSVV